MIKKVVIKNYKIFDHFELPLNAGLNIVVGDNEAGKSTILEAINLALTKRLNGRLIEQELTPYLFNDAIVNAYWESIDSETPAHLPEISIELYLEDNSGFEQLRGSMNSNKEDAIGIKLEITFDEDYREEYKHLLSEEGKKELIPAELYKVHWWTFANNPVTTRSLPIRLSYIDATTIRLQSGADYYLQDIIRSDLDSKERVELNLAYRRLKEKFSEEESIVGINKKLTDKKGAITDKDLSIAIDISQRSNWETNLVPHLDRLPFHFIGKGEQNALKIMLALERKAEDANVILIEEPENHLSFSSMNTLVSKIRDKCAGKQIIVTTHSTYVLNKLGLENLVLLHDKRISTLRNLTPSTQEYFKKLAGYDTLRLVLAKKAILVEGPSDELLVQKAYLQKYGKLPIDDGVDVISVRGLSFLRFLEIAADLRKDVAVVTDNDGHFLNKVDKKYAKYKDVNHIAICRSDDNDAKTLELQMTKCNELDVLNRALSVNCKTLGELEKYMQDNKTDWALKILETSEQIEFPQYVSDAIK